jgi:hypothetical protein
MKSKWPTLEGRLKNALTDEEIALQQLQSMLPLSEEAKKRLTKIQKKKK